MELTRVAILVLLAFGSSSAKVKEENPEFWRSQAQKTLHSVLDRKLNTNVAKNILFFLGDGMGITTYTAARILKGQLQNQTGEETVMTMDTFPNVGLAKVHTHVGRGGKSVGIVTTTRVQHATPATSYAHSASRKWYSDADMPDAAKRDGCTDIASQLLKNTDIDVIIGGGRKYMTPKGTKDPEYPRDFFSRGKRKDGRNLIDEWQSMKIGKVAHYVWNKTDFDSVDPETTDYLMALFEPGDLRFEAERDPNMDPSIVETTEKAIRILQKNPKGFFLLVEGGRIDQAHHAGRAFMALHETVAFDYAIAKGLELTKEQETLTIVMADHSHPVTFNGYPFRGQSILGKSPLWATDMLPYTTLMYGNGPGHKITNGKRPDIRNVNTKTKDYVQLSAVPTESATHSGEDVAVLARGPMGHLFQGVQEQNYIAHAMAYAACVGTDQRHCQGQTEAPVLHSTLTNDRNAAGAVRGSIALLGSLLSVLLAHTVLV
ncbi:alkaline phosphatase, tissue-nonspecific isozyme [Morone saxatilis]|uniref:alkaline phosphatase, tissue-nonspecific isozyme n=1 Tax=Morone saxatilis TaxID=34816 RepID=UPI0015E1F839|nr:alkaline phosphatase, tissue-nonspecific isozyme [Morone saxatilis]